MICFSYFCQKNCFPFRVCPIITPFLCKLDPKKQFLRGFTNFFSQNYWIATQVININWISYYISLEISQKKVKWVWSVGQKLSQIWYNVVEKQRKTGISMGFSLYLAWGIHLQARSSVDGNIWVKTEGSIS